MNRRDALRSMLALPLAASLPMAMPLPDHFVATFTCLPSDTFRLLPFVERIVRTRGADWYQQGYFAQRLSDGTVCGRLRFSRVINADIDLARKLHGTAELADILRQVNGKVSWSESWT